MVDRESSSKYVYLHRNIERVAKVDDRGTPVLLWQYEEARITQEEYEQYDNVITELFQSEIERVETTQNEKHANMQATIEYIAMMADIDLEE